MYLHLSLAGCIIVETITNYIAPVITSEDILSTMN